MFLLSYLKRNENSAILFTGNMKSKFDIYQLITPNIDEYAQYGLASVHGYAKKHRYSYSVQRSQLVEDMHVNWTKIETVSYTHLTLPTKRIV